ncbi:helix-turn-helix domain-containing protein [Silvibacterium acidisoli]|uniref:helix-turn-helix domain-containing protein n=1 Tax=Acidobacteriaceae bacterium ZG23-2 TaxID=2883246 RepID=UPI00406C322E
MPKGDQPKNFDVMTAPDVAELLGVSEKTVRNWMNKNGLPFQEAGRGRLLNWHEALKWYVNYRIAESGNDGNGVSNKDAETEIKPRETLEQAIQRKTIAEADRLELKLAQERGYVVAVSDVEKSVAAVATALKQAILGMPSKLITRLYGVRDKNAIRAILDAEARDLCVKLATIGQKSAPAPTAGAVDEL